MPCETWRMLLEKCYQAESAYAQILADSNGLVGVAFEDAMRLAEEARKASVESETALQRHERMHGCMNSSAAKAS
jgi:hypothetical protein